MKNDKDNNLKKAEAESQATKQDPSAPTEQQFERFAKLPEIGKFWMLNLMRFNDVATYPDGRKVSGAVAYETYEKVAGPIFREIGGLYICRGKARLVFSGPENEHWDLMIIAQYPSKEAFFGMLQRQDYLDAYIHRKVAVSDSRVINLEPGQISSI